LIPKPKEYKIPHKLQSRLESMCRKVKILSRINIRIKPEDINVYLHHLKSKNVQNFDLIGLEPSDNQVLMYLCTNNFNADIITINSGIECGLTDKHLIRPIQNAINSLSLCFELNYSSSLSSSTERRDMIMAGRCLAFNTKLNGLILSSRASQKLSLRGPYDLLNL
jgi:RNase P/RNase MRP subunit p30